MKKSEKFGQDFEIINADSEELELELMDIEGVNDIEIIDYNDGSEEFKALEIMCNREGLDKVRTAIQEKELKLISAELIKIADQKVSLSSEDREKLDKLVSELEECDDVDSVWTNAG
jgi:transcriptional/translational regulatory protein YebC/TACO1